MTLAKQERCHEVASVALAAGFRQLAALLRLYPAETELVAGSGLDASRRNASAWLARHTLQPATGVRITRLAQDSCTVYEGSCTQPKTHVLFIHGGGLVYNSTRDYDGVLSYWSAQCALTITGFDYPKAPEHSFDTIFQHLQIHIARRIAGLQAAERIILAGDSIGAYIALALATTCFPGRFERLVLIYPVLDLWHQRSSYALYGSGYFLSAAQMTWYQRLARTTALNANFEPFSLTLEQRRQLPNIDLYSAEYDVLRDEALDWVREAHGLDIRHRHFTRLPHNFCLYAGTQPAAMAGVMEISRSWI